MAASKVLGEETIAGSAAAQGNASQQRGGSGTWIYRDLGSTWPLEQCQMGQWYYDWYQ